VLRLRRHGAIPSLPYEPSRHTVKNYSTTRAAVVDATVLNILLPL
jgi:hypothetical protein